MAIALKSVSAIAYGTYATGPTVTLPAHASGDFMLACMHAGANTIAATSVFSEISGGGTWTKIWDLANAALGRDKQGAMFYRFATGGAETNPQFDTDAAGTGTVVTAFVALFTGVHATSPIDAQATPLASQNDPNAACPAITTVAANAWVIIQNGHGHDRTTLGQPAGFTDIKNDFSVDRNIMVSYLPVVTPALTTPAAWTGTVNAAADCIKGTISLAPAPAGGGGIEILRRRYEGY